MVSLWCVNVVVKKLLVRWAPSTGKGNRRWKVKRSGKRDANLRLSNYVIVIRKVKYLPKDMSPDIVVLLFTYNIIQIWGNANV